jgi:uncharacterized protein (DUF433 family)
MHTVMYPHIEVRDGVPFIEDTRHKIRMIAADHTLKGWSAAEIQEAYPHLSMAQIHSALAYYYDHRESIDADIAEGERYVEEMRARHGDATDRLRERLRAAGRIP